MGAVHAPAPNTACHIGRTLAQMHDPPAPGVGRGGKERKEPAAVHRRKSARWHCGHAVPVAMHELCTVGPPGSVPVGGTRVGGCGGRILRRGAAATAGGTVRTLAVRACDTLAAQMHPKPARAPCAALPETARDTRDGSRGHALSNTWARRDRIEPA